MIANIDHGAKLKLSKIPFWRVILKNYDMSKIAFIFGGDQSPCVNSSSCPTGETLQYFLQYGVCFVRESYDSFEGLAMADWPRFAEIRKSQWERKIKMISNHPTAKVDWLPNYC